MPAAAVQQLTAAKKRVFLDALSRCGNITEAAAAAKISRWTLYRHRHDEPAFAAAWDEAIEVGTGSLEDEAIRRAYDGVEEPVTSAKGLVYGPDGKPLMVRKYSDNLLMFLLKGKLPEKYRERVSTTHSGDPNQPLAIVISRRGDGGSGSNTNAEG